MRKRRPLRPGEVEALERRGCTADDWSSVLVDERFAPGRSFRRVHFSGSVELGVYEADIPAPEGFAMPAGVSDSFLHDVRVGDNCVIRHSLVASTEIGDDCVLDRVDSVSRTGGSSFANGLPANVLAEDGARAVPLWRNLDSNLAHLLCHFKGHPAAAALERMILDDAGRFRLPVNVISPGCRIRRAGRLLNVWLGEGCELEGVGVLENCHVDSVRAAPARVGEGVSAVDSVFQRSCDVSGGARLDRCLVGEGVKIGEGFSARHSLFFANSEFGLGEADCAMAGPFSVSLHKASLALTCQCSFANFGSGSNSSNHRFKLGPRHGGVLRRGVKCGSGSYLLWPADIGAFTTVIGRHAGSLDTSDFPFSLLVAGDGRSTLAPGVNLFSSGMLRDERKWRDRDRRGAVERPRDLINPAVLSPYVLQAMDAGADLLRSGREAAAGILHGGAVIPAGRVERALALYDAAATFHTGERLFAGAAAENGGLPPTTEELAARMEKGAAAPENRTSGRWRDWGGLLVPGFEAERFASDMEAGILRDPEAVRERLLALDGAYSDYEWEWLARRWRRANGSPTPEAVAAFVERWRVAVRFRLERIVADAGKEFSAEARYGFGLELDAEAGFRMVRGAAAGHPLIVEAEAETRRLLAMAERIPMPGAARI